jgi:hypothetical protein
MRRRTILAGLFLFPVLLGCSRALPSYRYKLTVEVETPEGLRTGSTIVEVQTHTQWPSGGQIPPAVTRSKGEAVVVNLGAHGCLFMLLKSASSADWADDVYPIITPPVERGPNPQEAIRRANASYRDNKGLIEIRRYYPTRHRGEQRSGYPRFVRFRDLKDYRTLEEVDPDDLQASFGKGVRLKRLTVQITDEAPEPVVGRYLSWLKRDGEKFDSLTRYDLGSVEVRDFDPDL